MLLEQAFDQASAQALAALDEVALNAGTYEHLLAGATNVIAETLGTEKCGVMLWERSSRALQMLPGSFGASENVTKSYRVLDDDERSNASRVFSTGRPFISNAANGDLAILQDYVDAFDIRKLMSLPLGVGARRTGVVHFANREQAFDASDVQSAETIAVRLAVCVEHVRRLVILRRQERLQAVLARLAERILEGASLARLVPPALEDLIEMSGAGCAAFSPCGAPSIVRHGHVADLEVEREFLAESVSQPSSVEERLAYPSRAGDPGWSAIHVPVFVADERVGTLSLLQIGAEPRTTDERIVAERLADLMALAWAAERYQQERAAMARMRERERIADDLHDHAAQILFSSKLALEEILDRPSLGERDRASVVRAKELLTSGESAIRDAVNALSTGNDDTLVERLERLVLEVEDQFDIVVHLTACGAQLPEEANERTVSDLALRVAREALINAAKHARPSRISVDVRISRRNRLLVTVNDDGLGMPAERSSKGHGLPTLRRVVRDHNGTLRITRGELGGTSVTASLVM